LRTRKLRAHPSIEHQMASITMAAISNQQWIYTSRPDGLVGPANYQLRSALLAPELAADEVLVQTRWLSADPYMRINQSSKATWMAPHPIGVVQSGAAVVQVLASASADFATGDFALAQTGWQTHAKVHTSALSKLNPAAAPVQTALGVLGMPGRTAWFGFTEALQPKPMQVLVVSGAAGAVGSLVVQFARLAGVRVLAIAGSAEKCAWLKTIGAEWALNYKDFTDANALQAGIFACCNGVDMYFDNVGGMVSDAVFPLINRRARI
jgi:NADPH-dependent curcumin reductase CurA